MSNPRTDEWLTLPLAIIIAGALVGAGLYFGITSLSGNASAPIADSFGSAGTAPREVGQPSASPKVTVSADDHIRGSANAKVVIVEYSDLECPFCKQFHGTLKQMTSKFGPNEVAWVYRHFPLDALHSKARKEAEATECAAELGGNAAFWKYTDRLFEISPTNNGLDPNELPKIAEYIGLDRKKFESCLSSGKYAKKVEAHYQSGVAAGAQGTPYSVIVTAQGTTPLGGAVPPDALEAQLKSLLGK